MKLSPRTSLVILLLGLALILGILFRAFIQDNFVTPVALVIWAIWRLLLTVDQNVYWGWLIIAAGTYAVTRLASLSRDPLAAEPTSPPDTNATLEQVNYWRTSMYLTQDETEKPNSLRRDLAKMLVDLYASKQHEAVHFKIYEALQQRQIPLPDDIYAFLFPAEPGKGKRSFRRILSNLKQLPRRRIRHWTGRDVADYYQSIEDVIRFMETALETQHGDEHLDIHQD
jgi:hypothetical protein